MPPCIDVYVWIPQPSPADFRLFIDRYVDVADPGDDRLAAFQRVFVDSVGSAEDRAELDTLARTHDAPAGVFSLYVHAREHEGAIITVTEDGSAVLGLSVDDPDGSLEVDAQATALMKRLQIEFSAAAAIYGTELPPPHSASEWNTAWPVTARLGARCGSTDRPA